MFCVPDKGGAVMKRRKKRQMLAMLLCTVLAALCFPIAADADTGPKPSVKILFENMGDGLCYGTLLSETESTGPASAYGVSGAGARYREKDEYAALDYETWKAFVEYEDADGYYFLQEGWRVSETKEIDWNYYPPNSFKILLYYPETETFAVSGIYERYAFDSYYTVDMDGAGIGAVTDDEGAEGEHIEAHRSYDYRQEIFSLIARIVLTIGIEMTVALAFGFRTKKPLLLLTGVNTATQVILNVLLNVINYRSGQKAFVIYYVLLEMLVIAIETILYCILMKKLSEKSRGNFYYFLYSLLANGASFGVGMLIAQKLPGIF